MYPNTHSTPSSTNFRPLPLLFEGKNSMFIGSPQTYLRNGDIGEYTNKYYKTAIS
jgi:hypothetical protein